MENKNKILKTFEILYFIATLSKEATSYSLQADEAKLHPNIKQIYRASSQPFDLPQNCISSWQSEASLQLCAADYDLYKVFKEIAKNQDGDSSASSKSGSGSGSGSGSIKLQTFLEQNQFQEIEIYYQSESNIVDCLKFVNQGAGYQGQFGSKCTFDAQTQQKSSKLPEGLLIGIETELEKFEAQKCTLSLIFNDSYCMQNSLISSSPPIAVSTQLGKASSLLLTDMLPLSIESCNNLEVQLKSSQIVSTATSPLNLTSDIIIEEQNGCSLTIKPQNCSQVGTHLVSLNLIYSKDQPNQIKTQLHKEQQTHNNIIQEIRLQIDVTLCELQHQGKTIKQKIQVSPQYDHFDFITTLQMWEQKMEYDDDSEEINDSDSYCAHGITWQFKENSLIKEGGFNNGVFEIDSDLLQNGSNIDFELLYEQDCPQVYRSKGTLVQMSMEIELDDQLEKIEFQQPQNLNQTWEIPRNNLQDSLFEDLERSLDSSTTSTCNPTSYVIDPETSQNSATPKEQTVYAAGNQNNLEVRIKGNTKVRQSCWSAKILGTYSTDPLFSINDSSGTKLLYVNSDNSLIGSFYLVELQGYKISDPSIVTLPAYYKLNVECATTALDDTNFPATYSDQIIYTNTLDAVTVTQYWARNLACGDEQLQILYLIFKCKDSDYTNCTSSSHKILRQINNRNWDPNNWLNVNAYDAATPNSENAFKIKNDDNNYTGFYKIELQAQLHNHASQTITSATTKILKVEVLSSCYLVELDDTQLSPVMMSLDMVKTYSLKNFDYTLPGSGSTPSCGAQSLEFGSLGSMVAEVTDQTGSQFELEFDSTYMTAGSEFIVPLTITLDKYGPYGLYDGVSKEYDLWLHVYQAVLTVIPSYNFVIGDKPTSFVFSTSIIPDPETPFVMTIAGYKQTSSYNAINPNATRSDLPSSSNFYTQVEMGLIQFYTNLATTVGTNIFEYSISFRDNPSWYHVSEFLEVIVEAPPTQNITFNSAPRFESFDNWVSPSYVGCRQKFTLGLPPIVDDDPGDEGSLHKVKLGSAIVFAEFNENKNQIEIPEGVITEDLNGSYDIKVELIDNQGEIGTHNMELIVACNSAFIIKAEEIEEIIEEFNEKGERIIIIEPKIVKINGMGEVFIDFNTQMQMFQVANDKSNKGLSCQDTFIRMANGQEKPLLELNVISQDKSQKFEYSYNCTEFKDTMVKLQVNYTNPEAISTSTPRERLSVTFWGLQNYFKPTNGGRIMLGTTLEAELPCQINKETGEKLDETFSSGRVAAQAQMVLQFIANITFKSQLNSLFSAIKKLQIVVHQTLVSVAVPAAPLIFYGYLLDICSYSFLPTDLIFTYILQLPTQEAVSVNFDQVGYGTSYYTLNVGDLFLIAIWLPLQLLVARLLLSIDAVKWRRKAEQLTNPIYYEGPISLIEESFVITSVSAFLGVFSVNQFDMMHPGQLFNFLCSIIMTIFVTAWPFCVYKILNKNIEKIRVNAPGTENYESLWGEMFIPKKRSLWYKFQSNKSAITFQFYSYLRRYLLAFSVVFLLNQSLFCLFAINFTTLAAMIIAAEYRPFKTKRENRLEIQNELIILFINYHFMYFTDYCLDSYIRQIAGYSLISLTTIFLFLNIWNVFETTGFQSLKGKFAMYKLKKKRLQTFRKYSKFDNKDLIAENEATIKEYLQNQDPNLAQVYDEHGKVHFIPKQQQAMFVAKVMSVKQRNTEQNLYFRRPYLGQEKIAVKFIQIKQFQQVQNPNLLEIKTTQNKQTQSQQELPHPNHIPVQKRDEKFNQEASQLNESQDISKDMNLSEILDDDLEINKLFQREKEDEIDRERQLLKMQKHREQEQKRQEAHIARQHEQELQRQLQMDHEIQQWNQQQSQAMDAFMNLQIPKV